MMKKNLNRRSFVKKSVAGGLSVGVIGQVAGFNILSQYPVKDVHKVAVMGVNSRGTAHVTAFSNLERSVITHICDVDSRAIDKSMEIVKKSGQKGKPKGITDIREALDSKEVDIVSIAAPDHWHAPASILAMKAGKHVYVEKPGSHNPREGEMVTEASKKYNKVVQMGNQRRSLPFVRQAIKVLHEGAIGRVYFAKTWYGSSRPTIGYGKVIPVPEWLDWELWQGPAPRKELKDNVVHYDWHWRWHWGTGELLNNGTHFIDLARWGLQVDFPIKAYSGGGRYHFKDDWETPDTQLATFDFADGKSLSWEGRSCVRNSINGMGSGVIFHGEKGTMELSDTVYKIFDVKGALVEEKSTDTEVTVSLQGAGFDYDRHHFDNFMDSIEGKGTPNSVYSDCYKSVMLCHLGNISYRTGRSLQCDPSNGHIKNDSEAMKLWSREYDKNWEPSV